MFSPKSFTIPYTDFDTVTYLSFYVFHRHTNRVQ